MHQFLCFIFELFFLTLSAAAFTCAGMVSSGPVGQSFNDDVERVAFFSVTLAAAAVLGQRQLALARSVFQSMSWLPQDLSAAQSVWALFDVAQLGGRLETATGLGPANPTAS